MNLFAFMRRPQAVLAVLVLLAACANGYWIFQGSPRALVDASPGRIACVSYAPYRLAAESPFDPKAHVDEKRIEADLSVLSTRFNCVRTYSVGQGLDQVPGIAKRHHMKVLLGIWLSRDVLANQVEMTLASHLAQTEHDTITAIVVGNEVLLRGELSPSALIADIASVRATTDLPVTYADVWEFWLKYPEVAPAVSFITIHILPYWEDNPVPIEEAVAHVANIRERVAAKFPGRDILIGETGWPSAGRQRQGARPSLVNEARFIREFLNWAQANQVRYNVIEAFDQPWKRLLEGTAGGYWGIYDGALHEKFADAGPVVEAPHFRLPMIGGAILGLLFSFLLLFTRQPRMVGVLMAFFLGDGIGVVAAAQLRELLRAERTPLEWSVGIALSLFGLGSALLLARTLLAWRGDRQAAPSPAPQSRFFLDGSIGCLRFAWLYLASVMNLLLIFDGRYRDFPIFLYAAPVVGLTLVTLLGERHRETIGRYTEFLSVWVAFSSVIVLVLETVRNGPADLWVLLGLVLGTPGVWLVASRRLRAYQQKRA
jgi:exo-beta-1,3-glucanase (GH17 family)